MSLIVGFAPLMVYCVMAPLSVSLALWLAFAAAFALGTHSFGRTGVLRLLDGTGMALFGVLALYDGFIEPGMSVPRISAIVEFGFFAAVLWSLVTRRPFTLQYMPLGHEDPALRARANVILTTAWALVFAAMAGAQAATTLLHVVPAGWSAGGGLIVFAGALAFTWQFGVYIDRRAGKDPVLGRR